MAIKTLITEGLERTHTQSVLEAMAYNLKRMPGLLCSMA